MDALGLQSTCLAGHSMGGGIALAMSVASSATCECSCACGTGAKLRVAQALLDAASQADTFPQAVEMVIEKSFSNHVDLACQRVDQTAHVLDTSPNASRGPFSLQLLQCAWFSPGISAPTLILWAPKMQWPRRNIPKPYANKYPAQGWS